MRDNLSQFLIELLKNQYEDKVVNDILDGYRAKRRVTLRINTIKSSVKDVKNFLDENKIKFKEVVWSNEALIIENMRENDIKKLDIYENGKIYMQSLSSMLPPIILEPRKR